ncbi:MAG: methyl-accepting chemotaxis protein, partial [Lawsonibacter sp.]
MCFIICIVLLLSLSSIYLTSSSTQQSLTKSLSQSAELASQKITKQIDQFATIAQASALYVDSVDITHVSITKYLREACTQYGITSIDILRADGMSILNGKRYGDDNVYLQAKSGTPFLSDPIIDGDSASFQYGYPINDQIVIVKFPYEIIGDIVSDVKIGDSGSTYILNRDGTKVSHDDFSLVLNQQNNLNDSKTDPSTYGEVADLETKMVNGETGFGFYHWDGAERFGAYTHIEGTNGWSINVTALTSEFMSGVTLAIVISVVLGLVSILVATLAVLRIAGSITRPIEQVAEAVERLSEGDLDIHLDMKRRDEVGLIAERVDDMAKKFKEIISDISCFLEALSHGDLTAESKCDYPGEFQDIRIAMEQITTRLNGTLSVISAAADQVNSSSEQISGAAQGLASGTAEQAAAIEQLNASVESISKQAEKTLDRVNQTTAFVRQI